MLFSTEYCVNIIQLRNVVQYTVPSNDNIINIDVTPRRIDKYYAPQRQQLLLTTTTDNQIAIDDCTAVQ